MKKPVYLVIIIGLFAGVTRLYAQGKHDTTQFLLSEKVEFSGFGAPFVEFSSVNNEFAVCLGAGGGLLISQTVFIGGYFEGMMTNHYREDLRTVVYIEKPEIAFEHGGIWLGYIYQHNRAIHGGLSLKLGWGEIDLEGNGYDNTSGVDYDFRDRIFTVIPQAEIELNLTKWFKVNVGLGYRFVTGIDATYFDEQGNQVNFYKTSDYNSPIGTISLIFGGRHEHVK